MGPNRADLRAIALGGIAHLSIYITLRLSYLLYVIHIYSLFWPNMASYSMVRSTLLKRDRDTETASPR